MFIKIIRKIAARWNCNSKIQNWHEVKQQECETSWKRTWMFEKWF